METQWETKNKSKAEEKRHILFFVCLEGAGVDTALYAPCITRRTQGRKIYTCQKSCCCCCATPANSARSDQVVTYSKRLDPDTRRTKHIVAICGACQTECYALSITHSNNTKTQLRVANTEYMNSVHTCTQLARGGMLPRTNTMLAARGAFVCRPSTRWCNNSPSWGVDSTVLLNMPRLTQLAFKAAVIRAMDALGPAQTHRWSEHLDQCWQW